MNQPITDKQVEQAIASGNAEQIRSLRTALIDRKKQIEVQLADDKLAMQEQRASLLRSGLSSREAQVRATGDGDQDWRARAVAAGAHTDRQLARLRAALVQSDERTVSAVVLRGDPEQIAEQLEARIPLNGAFAVMPYLETVILVVRG